MLYQAFSWNVDHILLNISLFGIWLSTSFHTSRQSTHWIDFLLYIYSTQFHYSGVIMNVMASQITGVSILCLTVGSDTDQRKKWKLCVTGLCEKHQSSVSLAFVLGIHWWQVNSPHKGPVTRKMFPFDDVIMSKEVFISFIKCPGDTDFNAYLGKCKQYICVWYPLHNCWFNTTKCNRSYK